MNRLSDNKSQRAFSLVEVALALGICSFCLVAVLGLLPVGASTNRDTVEQTAAAAVAREVTADFWGVSSAAMAAQTATNTPRFQIPLPTAITASKATPAYTFFLAEDGTKMDTATTITAGLTTRYRVDIAYGARANVNQPTPLRVLVTWPAAANQKTNAWPTNLSGSFQAVTVLNTF